MLVIWVSKKELKRFDRNPAFLIVFDIHAYHNKNVDLCSIDNRKQTSLSTVLEIWNKLVLICSSSSWTVLYKGNTTHPAEYPI